MSASPVKTQDVENRVIREIRGALDALSSRRLMARKNQTRVVSLMRQYFDTPFDITEKQIERIVTENPAPEGWESTELPVAIFEARQNAINEYMRETQKIPVIPKDELLTDDDLPKLIAKGDLADANQTGLGQIMRKLHFVYPMKNEKAPVKDGEDGEDTAAIEE